MGDDDYSDVCIDEQIAEAELELKIRRIEFSRHVKAGKMKETDARQRYDRQKAIIKTLKEYKSLAE